MKILYDHQTFVYQRFGGISRYFTELATYFNKTNNTEARISAFLSDNAYLKSSSKNQSFSLFNGKFPGSMTVYNHVNRFMTIKQLLKGQFDIFHPTYYDTYFLKALGNRPFVLTVHDMIHELYPNKWPNQERISADKAILIRKAAHIITVSEHTKKDLLHFYPEIPAYSVSVIWHGSSAALHNNSLQTADEPYFLFVGNRDEYKNFNFLLKATASYLKSNPGVNLIAAGGGHATPEELEILKELEIENLVRFAPGLTDSQLGGLYKNALALIFPSAYEGFGIPILEAFEAGCPVILSNASCFPEIGGNAALYFNTQNPETLLSAMEKIKNENSERSELIQKGKERLSLFSWEQTALKTLDVYRAIIEQYGK